MSGGSAPNGAESPESRWSPKAAFPAGLNPPQYEKKEKKLSKILEGSAKIERNNFLETFDFGTPNDGKSEVLLLYNDHEALPSNYKSLPLYFLSSMNATRASENCDYVHVVTIPRDDHRVW